MFDFKQKWNKAGRNSSTFIESNRNWLETKLSFPNFPTSLQKTGRPITVFAECSENSKRQKTAGLRKTNTLDEICYAAQMELRKAGNVQASKLVKEILASPAMASKYIDAYKNSKEMNNTYLPPEEALSVLVEAKLSRNQYHIIRQKDKNKFPSYKVIQKAKFACYPDNISVTSMSAEVPLKSLLEHTTKRILLLQKDVLHKFDRQDLANLVLVLKWGFDGSSGQRNYKQKFNNENDSDSSAFVSWLVPIKLVVGSPKTQDPQKIVWQNPCPSSPRYCRPIRIRFTRESIEVSKQEQNDIETQIKLLGEISFQINDFTLIVHFFLILAMIDGKIRNALTENKSTQKCYVCLHGQKDFNNIDLMLAVKCDPRMYQFSLPVLHSRIRCFEYLLHLAYKLPVKLWQVRNQDDKSLVAKNKKRIQQEFKLELGLIIDQPKPGYGSSNDGNTARRFFENAEITSKITHIDINIIKKFSVILEVISSYYNINTKLFTNYCLETARLLVKTFPWYYITPTVHLILIHGPDVIKNGIVPVGQLSEEAAESRNKDIKQYRERFTRKISRIKTNEDLFKRLLLSSDPMITGIRKISKFGKNKNFSSEALSMLLPLNNKCFLSKESSDESDSNSDSE